MDFTFFFHGCSLIFHGFSFIFQSSEPVPHGLALLAPTEETAGAVHRAGVHRAGIHVAPAVARGHQKRLIDGAAPAQQLRGVGDATRVGLPHGELLES